MAQHLVPKMRVVVRKPADGGRVTQYGQYIGHEYKSLRANNRVSEENCTWWPDLNILTPRILFSHELGPSFIDNPQGNDKSVTVTPTPGEGCNFWWEWEYTGDLSGGSTVDHIAFVQQGGNWNLESFSERAADGTPHAPKILGTMPGPVTANEVLVGTAISAILESINYPVRMKHRKDVLWQLTCLRTPYFDSSKHNAAAQNMLPGRYLFGMDITWWADQQGRSANSATDYCPICNGYTIPTPKNAPHMLIELGPWKLRLDFQHDIFNWGEARLTVYYWMMNPATGQYQSYEIRRMKVPEGAIESHGDNKKKLHLFAGHVGGNFCVGFNDNAPEIIIRPDERLRPMLSPNDNTTILMVPLGIDGTFGYGVEDYVIPTMHGVNIHGLFAFPYMYWAPMGIACYDLETPLAGASPYFANASGYAPAEGADPQWFYGSSPPQWWGHGNINRVMQPVASNTTLRVWDVLTPLGSITPGTSAYGYPVMGAPGLGYMEVYWPTLYSAPSSDPWCDISAAIGTKETTIEQSAPLELSCIEARIPVDYEQLELFCNPDANGQHWRDHLMLGSDIQIDIGWEDAGNPYDVEPYYRVLEGTIRDDDNALPGFKQGEHMLTARDWFGRTQKPAGVITGSFPKGLDRVVLAAPINPITGLPDFCGATAIEFLMTAVLGPYIVNAGTLIPIGADTASGHWSMVTGWPFRKGQATSGSNGFLWPAPYGGDAWGWMKDVAQYDCAVLFMRRNPAITDPVPGQAAMQFIYGPTTKLGSTDCDAMWARHDVWCAPTAVEYTDYHIISQNVQYKADHLINHFEIHGTVGPGGAVIGFQMRDEDSLQNPAAPNFCRWLQTILLEGPEFTQADASSGGSVMAAALQALYDRFHGRRPISGPWHFQGQPDWQLFDIVTMRDIPGLQTDATKPDYGQGQNDLKDVDLRIVKITHRIKKASFHTDVDLQPWIARTL
jgi:hypothetical protein